MSVFSFLTVQFLYLFSGFFSKLSQLFRKYFVLYIICNAHNFYFPLKSVWIVLYRIFRMKNKNKTAAKISVWTSCEMSCIRWWWLANYLQMHMEFCEFPPTHLVHSKWFFRLGNLLHTYNMLAIHSSVYHVYVCCVYVNSQWYKLGSLISLG